MPLDSIIYSEPQFAALDKALRRLPTHVMLNASVRAARAALKFPHDIAKSPNFLFTDRSGALRRSIRIRSRPKNEKLFSRWESGRDTSLAFLGAGGAGARHAHLVHLGHGGRVQARAYRYLTFALYQGRGQIFFAYVKSMQKNSNLPAEIRKLAREVGSLRRAAIVA